METVTFYLFIVNVVGMCFWYNVSFYFLCCNTNVLDWSWWDLAGLKTLCILVLTAFGGGHLFWKVFYNNGMLSHDHVSKYPALMALIQV